MRLSRLGSFHQSRISFMRVLLRRIVSENWRFDAPDWQVDNAGVGHAVYTVHGPNHTYSLVAFAHDLPAELRSDRVIAEAWDATFTLHDGIPTAADIERLRANVPLQEAGRISSKELTLARANRSVRLWEYVVDCLSRGEQPEAEQLYAVGYLMRTTAVYGSGKFGASDRCDIMDRNSLRNPFQVEMLTVYLIRNFVMDLVEHMARMRGGDTAVVLEPELRRCTGIGNSTGLGMAPFLVHHPALLNTWVLARETALARVRAVTDVPDAVFDEMQGHLQLCLRNAENWNSQHEIQKPKVANLCAGMADVLNKFNTLRTEAQPWDALYRWVEQNACEDVQEQVVSALLEPYPELVDDLSDCMFIDEAEHFKLNASGTTNELKAQIETSYDWALGTDYSAPRDQARFWYVSEAKLEPRLGERAEEEGCELEQPLAIARDVAALHATLNVDQPLADFLLRNPEHRHIVRRVQLAQKFPYSEIHDNLLDAEMLPIDMLRCKLSFFGATKFDPRSDRWVRICMFKNAPFPHELTSADNWSYGALPC
tara:strand:+ start:729 stop:2348 length:1620 start_codon:yes stop_codon:yes gene_type:complete